MPLDLSEFVFNHHKFHEFSDETIIKSALAIVRLPVSDHLSRTSQEAASVAAIKAGEYLGAIGKTDFDKMTGDERREFVRTIVLTHGREVRERILARERAQ